VSKWNGISSREHSDNKIYYAWNNIKERCYNAKSKDYKNYGFRGITMCKEWKDDFISFYNWAKSNGYKDGLEIDRIDVNGNYIPNNCQFITSAENNAVGKHRKQKSNLSGYVGIGWRKKECKWISRITISNKSIHLGYFNTKEQALQARIDKEIELFGCQKTNL
jgi:hypothetical protein